MKHNFKTIANYQIRNFMRMQQLRIILIIFRKNILINISH